MNHKQDDIVINDPDRFAVADRSLLEALELLEAAIDRARTVIASRTTTK